jgi:GNAT superfamily N-acetyltransferase
VLAPVWRLSVSENGEDRRRRAVAYGLGRHNGRLGHPDDWRPVSIFAHGPPRFGWFRGPLYGGLNGGLAWGWLYVSHLWIEDRHRRQGLGAALLAEAETLARQRGMLGTHLTTASFQARGFYEKQGYAAFGALDGMPPGETMFYMKKRF